MIQICALASGSNGNCYYIGNEKEAILIDAGISTKQILQRLYKKGLDVNKIKGVVISHEHSDHVRGVRVLTKKLGIPAFLTKKTFNAVWGGNQPGSYSPFQSGVSFPIKSFIIHPFLKNHDAKEPCSFRIEYNGINIGVLTDIGLACTNVVSNLKKCNALFLESNYDEDMLMNGSYPIYLKRRVASDVGHLSNDQAFDLINQHASKDLKYVILSHLSAENNTPEKAFEKFCELESKTNVSIASRDEPGEVFAIN